MKVLNDIRFFWLLLALPAIPMLTGLANGATAEQLLHPTGEFAARFMIIAMMATPLQMLFKRARWPLWLKRRRRALGVASFAYALAHTLLYLIDMGTLQSILNEVTTLGIWTGWVTFLIFVPLAITSNNAMVRKLSTLWKPIQRLVYPAAVLTLLHWIYVHNNAAAAWVHFIPLALLEIYRIAITLQQRLVKTTPSSNATT